MRRGRHIVPGADRNRKILLPLQVPGETGKWKVFPTLTNDQSILRNTTISIACPSGAVSIDWGDGTASAVTCDGTRRNYTHTYTATGTYTIRVSGNVELITQYFCNSQSWISGDIADAVAGLRDVEVLYLYSISISGNISALSPLTSLNTLYILSTPLSGDFSALSPLTSLIDLRAYTTAISGDISALATLTSMVNMQLHGTSASGDISALAPLTSLNVLYLYSTNIDTYTSGPLPAWPGTEIRIQNLGLSATEIDNFLIDLADGVGAGGSLTYIAGNTARTAASDAAVAALSAAGWGGDIP